jgi:Ca2+-binding EF-hand superfamily protein
MKSKPFLLIILFASACAPTPPNPPLSKEETLRKMIRLQQNFPAYDTNGDDRISRQELKSAMIKNHGKNVTDWKVDQVMDFYDFNQDQKISLREAQSGAVTGPEALIQKVQ